MGGATLNHENLNDHEIFIPKIYFNANLERFTEFSNHETLELYGILIMLLHSVCCRTFIEGGVHIHCVDV